MTEKNKIEAILFITGRFMSIEEVAKACNIGSVGLVKETLESLKNEYDQKESPLTIFEKDGLYKLNVKKEYGELANKLVSTTEFDSPTAKTLAVIAYRQPIFQAEVIKIRGNKAYDHVKQLLESNLITSEKSGRTRVLKITPRFYEYFDTAEEKVKEEFQKISEAVKKQAEEEQLLQQAQQPAQVQQVEEKPPT